MFVGSVCEQHHQVANAVSPQLAKAIGKQLLLSLLRGHGACDDDAAVEFSASLRAFRTSCESSTRRRSCPRLSGLRALSPRQGSSCR